MTMIRNLPLANSDIPNTLLSRITIKNSFVVSSLTSESSKSKCS